MTKSEDAKRFITKSEESVECWTGQHQECSGRTLRRRVTLNGVHMTWAKTTRSSTKRGYGQTHRKLRAALLPQAYGQPCARCGHPMLPGQVLHLDHNDARTGYLGFSHGSRCHICGRRCNLRAAAKKARAIQVYGKRVKAAHRW
jgi:hypothetical protein